MALHSLDKTAYLGWHSWLYELKSKATLSSGNSITNVL